MSSVYKRTGPKEQCIDESSETSECSGETSTSGERLRMKSLIDYWKCHPLENVWKETSCTLRYALSGYEHLVISRQKLKQLKTTRNLHQYVRESLRLQEFISLRLDYAEGRISLSRVGYSNTPKHTVQCNDSERLPAYLEGSILEILVWEDYCTFRYEGKDHFDISSRKLLELRTTRRLYQHVRECLNSEKHMSLRLEYVDRRPSRDFNRFNKHEVWCDDSERLPAYLEAAVLEIEVHP